MIKLVNFFQQNFNKALFKHFALNISIKDIFVDNKFEKSKHSMTLNILNAFKLIRLRF